MKGVELRRPGAGAARSPDPSSSRTQAEMRRWALPPPLDMTGPSELRGGGEGEALLERSSWAGAGRSGRLGRNRYDSAALKTQPRKPVAHILPNILPPGAPGRRPER